MIFIELGQAVLNSTHAGDVLAVVTGKLAPTPAPKEINTDGLIQFFASKIAPILLAVLGIIFIGRPSRGEASEAVTRSAISIISFAFVPGAGSLFFARANLI